MQYKNISGTFVKIDYSQQSFITRYWVPFYTLTNCSNSANKYTASAMISKPELNSKTTTKQEQQFLKNFSLYAPTSTNICKEESVVRQTHQHQSQGFWLRPFRSHFRLVARARRGRIVQDVYVIEIYDRMG